MGISTYCRAVAVVLVATFGISIIDADAGPLKKRRVYVDKNISTKNLVLLDRQLGAKRGRAGDRRAIKAELDRRDKIWSNNQAAHGSGRLLANETRRNAASGILALGIAAAGIAARSGAIGGGGHSHGH